MGISSECFLQRTSADSLDGRDGGARCWAGHLDWQQPRPAARLSHPGQGRPPRAQIQTPRKVGPQGEQYRLSHLFVSFLSSVFSFVDRGWPRFWFLLSKYLQTHMGDSMIHKNNTTLINWISNRSIV